MTPDDRPVPTESIQPLLIGSVVEVRTRYLGGWSPGFHVADYAAGGCRIGRSSEGCLFGRHLSVGRRPPVTIDAGHGLIAVPRIRAGVVRQFTFSSRLCNSGGVT